MFVDGRSCVSFVFLLLINKVSMQSVTVSATLGSTATLPCKSNQASSDAHWRYDDSRTVCDIIDRKMDFDEQDPAFSGRVESFPSEYAEGNFSIKLLNLTKSDTGTYTCNFAHTLVPWTVRLNVKEAQSANIMKHPDRLLLFLLGCGVLSTWTI